MLAANQPVRNDQPTRRDSMDCCRDTPACCDRRARRGRARVRGNRSNPEERRAMSWRKRLVLWCGPSILGGITFGDWFTLLRDNSFAIDPAYGLRAGVITLGSLGNSVHRRREEALYGPAIGETLVEPPLFVLGIWRSGTTHLQN